MTSIKVSTAEFLKGYGQLADQAIRDPVIITKNGNERLVLLSIGEYQRLKRRDRQVLRVHEVPDDLAAAIAAAEPPPEADEVERKLAKTAR